MKRLILKIIFFNAAIAATLLAMNFVYEDIYRYSSGPHYGAAFMFLTAWLYGIFGNLRIVWKGRKTILAAMKKTAIETAAIAIDLQIEGKSRAVQLTDAGKSRALQFKDAVLARSQERIKERNSRSDEQS